jgi:hypothetical protein
MHPTVSSPPTQPDARLWVIALMLVLGLALWARLYAIGWDGYAGLHPDERHVFFVTQALFAALRDPAHADLTLWQWWFSDQSPLNPHLGASSFVYGEAPLLAGALLGWALSATDWFEFMAVARMLSSVVDTLTVLAVFLGARLIATMGAAVMAAALYAAMPSALQLSSFHTVDVWLAMACTLALVPMIALAQGRGPVLGLAALMGAGVGLAIACKVTGVLMVLPGVIALGWAIRAGLARGRAGAVLLVALISALAVFRLTNPFAFTGPGLFGLWLSAEFVTDFEGLAWVTASPDFPPNWQWIAGYGWGRLARDFALFGVGPVAVALAFALPRGATQGAGAVVFATLAVFFLLTGISTVAALRYGSPALPALAILLAPALARLPLAASLLSVALAAWWGAGAVRLHDGAHPRLLASQWLWALPRGTILTNETAWDESLPTIIRLPGDTRYRWPGHDDWFTFQVLDITDPDTPQKAERIAAMLARTDFLILSSDRHSAVMPRLPERFPMTTAHYDAILSGQACFAPVLELDRGYPLPGLRLSDHWVQEPWRIYDHPIVRIYLREPCFSESNYAARLKAALKP